MQSNTVQNQESLQQIASLQEQIKKLDRRLTKSDQTIAQIGTSVGTLQQPPAQSGMINLINNGDFMFNDTGYNAGTYTDSDLYAAEWYRKAQSITGWTLSTLPGGAVSSQALRDDNSKNTYWNKTAGGCNLGGGYILGQKLFKKYLSGGNKVYVRFELSKAAGAAIAADIKLRASIYDNTAGQKKIIEGQVLELTPVRQGTAGTYTRKYILEVITQSGSFYSNVTTVPQVTTALSVYDTTDQTLNYIDVDWTPVLEQQAYRLYRYDNETSLWHLIAEITNGNSSFRDAGGVSGETATMPTVQVNPKASAEVVNIGTGITENAQDVVVSIRIPSLYNYSLTGEQWLQIEFLKSDGSSSTASEIPAGGLIIDKVGMSLANGRFMPSARDQQTIAATQTVTPPPTTGGGVPPIEPEENGGGYNGCVAEDAAIYAFNEATGAVRAVLAREVYLGMVLVGKDSSGAISRSKVTRIFHGSTDRLYNVITKSGFCLPCSPTHPIIQSADDFTGIAAHKLTGKSAEEIPILVSLDGKNFLQDYLEAVEVIHKHTKVLTFETEDKTMTYIANGIVSHNLTYKGYNTY